MKKTLNYWFCTVMLASCCLARVDAATLLFSDNFDSEHGGTATYETVNYRKFANFNVSGNGVDLLGVGFFDVWPGNGLHVDMAYMTGGRIETKSTFSLQTGMSYMLTFALAGNGLTNVSYPGYETDDSVTVTLGSYTEMFTRAYNAPFTTITRTITVAGPETASLVFDALADPDGAGVKLDAISLTAATSHTALDATSPVPEPASVLLCGAGLGLALATRRRSRRAQQ